MKKLFLVAVKYFPVVQTAGMLASNTLYYKEIYSPAYLLDLIVGNSLVCAILLWFTSEIFHFCAWHRTIILNNFAIACLAIFDAIHRIGISDKSLLICYYVISSIFYVYAAYNHYKHRRNESGTYPSSRQGTA